MTQVARTDAYWVLPGFASAHSHAFQRAFRGRSHAVSEGASFWSWRRAMYQVVDALTPERMYDLARFAYAELAQAGVTAVGEFHYVHHQADGTPYDDRTVLADAVVRAARDVGLRICLLRVLYQRGGHSRDLEPAQRRFSDSNLEAALTDVETLLSRHKDDPLVGVGLAPHSVRAVPKEALIDAARFAGSKGLPLHMHVSEQRRELEECVAEHGSTPVTLLAELGVLSERFCAVHATHLEPGEPAYLGDAGSSVCLCRTTERDLGDGFADVSALAASGVPICAGVDSHASSDPFEEARAIELDERARTQRRQVVFDGAGLVRVSSANGYRALGLDSQGDEVRLDAAAASLAGAATVEDPADAIMFAATGASVRQVDVAGRRIVDGGRIDGYGEARSAFERCLSEIFA